MDLGSHEHSLDRQYRQLHCSLDNLDKTSDEFQVFLMQIYQEFPTFSSLTNIYTACCTRGSYRYAGFFNKWLHEVTKKMCSTIILCFLHYYRTIGKYKMPTFNQHMFIKGLTYFKMLPQPVFILASCNQITFLELGANRVLHFLFSAASLKQSLPI